MNTNTGNIPAEKYVCVKKSGTRISSSIMQVVEKCKYLQTNTELKWEVEVMIRYRICMISPKDASSQVYMWLSPFCRYTVKARSECHFKLNGRQRKGSNKKLRNSPSILGEARHPVHNRWWYDKGSHCRR